jgi:hypothetical protein
VWGESAQYGADIDVTLKSETPDVKIKFTGPSGAQRFAR